MLTLPPGKWTWYVESYDVPGGYDPEYADRGNPQGITHYRTYYTLVALHDDGHRYLKSVAFFERDTAEWCAALYSDEQVLPDEQDCWERPFYGSPAYVHGGYEAQWAAQERAEDGLFGDHSQHWR